MSVSAIMARNAASTTPVSQSLSTQGWLDVYDLMTESLSSWTPSEKANSVVDIQTYAPAPRSFSGPLPLGGGAPRRDFNHHGPINHHHHQRKPSGHFSHRPPSMHTSAGEYNEPPRRSVSSIGSHYHHHHQLNNHHPTPPPPPPRPVNTQKDFQEAIVDIILENDVNDLVDLEEFLQGYFKLNSLYQEIIQQFFNDLSNDLVNPRVSKAPSVFARLASHSAKSHSSSSKANSRGLGRGTSSRKPS
ncbi:hypothetical protein R1flu_002559 [Riccia fluitans]|uniref:OVATE domain-containing protein n=1 Tax=Riccia fluitans TaxID=41844 RepID=A0ABD1YAA6_9MARC